MNKTCDYCQGPMNLPRRGARFCTTKCRVYAHRKAQKQAQIPDEMANSARFVRYTATKRPITAAGKSASSTNPATWTDYATALASTAGKGVGIVLGEGLGCIDLDHCMVDGQLLPWAAEVVAANPDTYIEVSMSGEGLHIFGILAEGKGDVIRDGRNIEIYSRDRYIALTGNRFGNAPLRLSELASV